MEPSTTCGSYFPIIDGLRTVAIAMVLVEHFGGPLTDLLHWGYYGVDLFFVISGFLITGILLRRGDASFGEAYWRFMGRRTLRIFPLYYGVVALLVCTGFANATAEAPWLLSYTWNYRAAMIDGDNPIFYLWSLSVEEQFYLIWPLFVLALHRQKAWLIGGTAMVVVFGLSQLVFDIVPAISAFNYTGLPNRMGSLGAGAMAAILLRFDIGASIRRRMAAFRVLALPTIAAALVWDSTWRLAVLPLASAVMVASAAGPGVGLRFLDELLCRPLMVGIGRISYGIYLFHWPLGMWFTHAVFDPVWAQIDFESWGVLAKLRWHSWIVKLPVVTILSILSAAISFRYFERPLLRLKEIWFPPPKTPSSSTSSAMGPAMQSPDAVERGPVADGS